MTYSILFSDCYSFLDFPKTCQFTSFNVTCDTCDGTYRASITFSNDETGGSDIQCYNGTVTGPSGFSSQFNLTTNTVFITGLQCSTSYNINVTAVNCAGVSTVKITSFTTPQPGECIGMFFIVYITLVWTEIDEYWVVYPHPPMLAGWQKTWAPQCKCMETRIGRLRVEDWRQ